MLITADVMSIPRGKSSSFTVQDVPEWSPRDVLVVFKMHKSCRVLDTSPRWIEAAASDADRVHLGSSVTPV